jgi:uncharacterized membrane protein YdjX (TVP38/TMEM64 family)
MFKVRRALYLQLACLALAIGLVFWLSRFFPVVDLIATAQRHVIDLGVWGWFCYPLLFALCNVLLLPGGILSIGSGFFFGLWWGFIIVLLGNSIGAAISFALSRWIGQRWFMRKLSRNPTLAVLEPAVEREGWKIILLSQLHPLFPTSLLNYLYGLTKIRFRTYMLWVSIGRAPGLFLYAYLGTLGQFGFNLVRGKSHPRIFEYWTWGGAFVVTMLILLLLSRVALQAVQNAECAGVESKSNPPRNRERAVVEHK